MVTAEISAAALYFSDYFYGTGTGRGLISHTWSLSAEEHFYLLWPAALLGLSKWSFFSKPKTRHGALMVVIVAVQLARLIPGARFPVYFFYSFEAAGLDALLMGCVIAMWVKDKRPLPGFLFYRWS